MVRKFEMSARDKKLIDRAIARLDSTKAGQVKASQEKALAVRKRREVERRNAKIMSNRERITTNAERQKNPLPGYQVLYARMEDGVWYTFGDLLALVPEYAKGSVKAWTHQKGMREGWLIRAGNPDWTGATTFGDICIGRYVYALSQKATESAVQWRLMLRA